MRFCSELYGLDVEVIDPSQYLLRPSNADYKITKDFIVEKIDGDPMDLRNFTLNQEISGARGSVSNVIPIDSQEYPGKYFQISVDSGFQRDISVQGTIFGEFQVEPKTMIVGQIQQILHSLMWTQLLVSQAKVNSLLLILMEVLFTSHTLGRQLTNSLVSVD